jgi:structural maintenance of chromosome 1
MNQLRELNKTKSRGKMDENLMGEVNRLESSLTVARDDLVSHVEHYAAVAR